MDIMQILIARGEVPGVPAAGHLVNGYWHPGGKRNCNKGNCPKDREKDKARG